MSIGGPFATKQELSLGVYHEVVLDKRFLALRRNNPGPIMLDRLTDQMAEDMGLANTEELRALIRSTSQDGFYLWRVRKGVYDWQESFRRWQISLPRVDPRPGIRQFVDSLTRDEAAAVELLSLLKPAGTTAQGIRIPTGFPLEDREFDAFVGKAARIDLFSTSEHSRGREGQLWTLNQLTLRRVLEYMLRGTL